MNKNQKQVAREELFSWATVIQNPIT
jgi:hypothetical protein